jgi:rhodanese-related sulfurtransferase
MKQITPKEAHELLEQDPKCVYIDVRTVREFSAGHPGSAVNIPVAVADPVRGMALNEKFVSVVEAHFSKDQRIVVGCQAGPRSDRAAEMLEKAGYQNVASVRGGYGGMRDRSGQLIEAGWLALGLPTNQENGDGVSYASLEAKLP